MKGGKLIDFLHRYRINFKSLIILSAVPAFGFLGQVAFAEDCSVNRVDLRWEGGAVRFQTEVAETPEEKAVGLMNRPQMPRFSSMLFVYDQERSVSFWMENTLIPLDMLFFNSKGELQKIHEEAIPLDRTAIPGGDNIQYVLEINGGMARDLGIELGAEMRHPALDSDISNWDC